MNFVGNSQNTINFQKYFYKLFNSKINDYVSYQLLREIDSKFMSARDRRDYLSVPIYVTTVRNCAATSRLELKGFSTVCIVVSPVTDR